ncbi:MAG TPA: pyruvate dehydrogenase (acetyl-transferring) E1 component subunit alpha [Chroococcales cyanobacterium]|jgi:pyruvate dehydrogenase E1 component alpha subunit
MDSQHAQALYHDMLLIRHFEDKAAEMYALGKIGGFLHLYSGEEAVAVGALAALRPDDDLFTSYRDHGYALARGCDPKAVMAELFGRETGLCKGRGGSMHLADASRHFWGGYAIVTGHLPLAAGMAFAHQHRKTDHLVLCVFGDGASNAGEFHETMNVAKVWSLPVLFLCENNLYAMGTSTREASAQSEMYKKGCSYGIESWQVDGMDVEAVEASIDKAAAFIRSGKGPIFVEALTYRFRGHSMADPELYRNKAEVEEWKKKDPIPNFLERCLAKGLFSKEDADRISSDVEQKVSEAVSFADESPEPPLSSLLNFVTA